MFSLTKNLLSMCQGTQNEVSIKFHHTFCSLKLFTPRGEPIHLQCPQVDSLYLLGIGFDASPPNINENNYFCFIVGINKNTHETIQLHHRLAHFNIFSMKEIQNKKLAIMPIILDFMELPFCEGYGQTFQGFLLSNETPFHAILDLMHSNICGPTQTFFLGGAKYFIYFIDDYSRYTYVYHLKQKIEAFVTFEVYKALVEKQND